MRLAEDAANGQREDVMMGREIRTVVVEVRKRRTLSLPGRPALAASAPEPVRTMPPGPLKPFPAPQRPVPGASAGKPAPKPPATAPAAPAKQGQGQPAPLRAALTAVVAKASAVIPADCVPEPPPPPVSVPLVLVLTYPAGDGKVTARATVSPKSWKSAWKRIREIRDAGDEPTALLQGNLAADGSLTGCGITVTAKPRVEAAHD